MMKLLNGGLPGKCVAALLICLGVIAAPIAGAQVDRPTEQRHQISLKDVEISDLIEDVSILTGYTFVVHPQVRGRVTVTSQTPLTTSEVFEVFLATLRVNQFVAIPSGKNTYRIVPEQTAASDAGIASYRSNDEAFVTQILKLNFFDAVDAAQMVKPIISPSGQVVANKNSNTLVVVDFASNLPRVRELVHQLDQDSSVVETVALKNIPAKEMEGILNSLKSDNSMKLTAISAESTNAVVLRGDEKAVRKAVGVVKKLDETERVRDNVRVIPLSNAQAVDIAQVLERLGGVLADQQNVTNTTGSAPTVSAHEPTNSLIISGEYELLNAMERVVAELDVRRPQVLVEALVAEVSDDVADELGVQFLVSGTEGNVPFVSTNYSSSAVSLLTLTGALVNSDSDIATSLQTSAVSSLVGLDGLTFGGGGVSGETLFGMIVNAVQSDVQSNILSTPILMAVDNELSSIVVGQEIPVTTGSAVGSDLTNAFTTVERKDVGIKLDVLPQIGEGNEVKLKIYQEASNIAGSADSGEIITNKRSIDTTVIADDGDIIVLGGLIEQTSSFTTSQVPVLGDVPVVGNLFKSKSNSNTRTNLMVFIRPTIIRDTEQARMTTAEKYRYLRAQEILKDDGDQVMLDQFISEVMATVPPINP